MTTDENLLFNSIDYLELYYTDNIDEFNVNLNILLQKYHVSLDRYHELLIERIEKMIEDGEAAKGIARGEIDPPGYGESLMDEDEEFFGEE